MGKTEESQELIDQMRHLKYQYNDSVELVNRELNALGLVVKGSLTTKLNVLIPNLKRKARVEGALKAESTG